MDRIRDAIPARSDRSECGGWVRGASAPHVRRMDESCIPCLVLTLIVCWDVLALRCCAQFGASPPHPFFPPFRHTYTALETELRNNAQNRVYKRLHFPKELERVVALEADLEFYFGEDWRTEDEVVAPPSACTQEYGDFDHHVLIMFWAIARGKNPPSLPNFETMSRASMTHPCTFGPHDRCRVLCYRQPHSETPPCVRGVYKHMAACFSAPPAPCGAHHLA